MAVIHDLNFEKHPEFIPWLVRSYYHYYFPRFARRAERIATVSEFTKEDIVSRYHVSPEKIDVVYNGANETYVPVTDEVKKETMAKYTGGCPYFIFVGTIHPRKNLTHLFKAFGAFKQSGDNNVKLFVVGDRKWWTGDIREAYEKLDCKEDVVFGGRMSSDELHRVIASALAMTYVSFFEGFGIPIVESFYCGVPVITSNVTSMPEVAGDAALLVDPFSVQSICDAMLKITTDEKFRLKLIEKGAVRKAEFTWQKSAERLWASMEKVLVN
jgi:glycosyltransferase involved in cell wall biosynthesis